MALTDTEIRKLKATGARSIKKLIVLDWCSWFELKVKSFDAVNYDLMATHLRFFYTRILIATYLLNGIKNPPTEVGGLRIGEFLNSCCR